MSASDPIVQKTYRGKPTARVRVYEYLDLLGHADVSIETIMAECDCSRGLTNRYRNDWKTLEMDILKDFNGRRCRKCSILEAPDAPINNAGVCIWCWALAHDVSLRNFVEESEYLWGQLFTWFLDGQLKFVLWPVS